MLGGDTRLSLATSQLTAKGRHNGHVRVSHQSAQLTDAPDVAAVSRGD